MTQRCVRMSSVKVVFFVFVFRILFCVLEALQFFSWSQAIKGFNTQEIPEMMVVVKS